MNHNRPYYDKKVCILIEDITKEFCLRSLPRWLEQNYENYFLLLSGDSLLYTDVCRICSRYGVNIKTDGRCIFTSSENLESVLRSLKYDVVLPMTHKALPLPYSLEILLMKIENDSDLETKPVCDNLFFSGKEWHYKKTSLFVPVMNRQSNVEQAFDSLCSQTCSNYELVYIDYSSEVPLIDCLEKLCADRNKSISYNEPSSNSFVKVLRIENQKYFNISHAYNFAIRQIETDIVSTICADSVPWDYYLETCYNLVNDKTFVQIHWGLHTLTKENWRKLNGHQEFIVGWGAEDDDFRIRSTLMGLDTIVLPSRLVYQIPQKHIEKGTHRKIRDISESSLTNMARFQQYIVQHGFVGNYNGDIGEENPVEYSSELKVEIPSKVWCFRNRNGKECSEIQYNEQFKLYYREGKDDWTCSDYCIGEYNQYYLNSSVDLQKILNIANRELI